MEKIMYKLTIDREYTTIAKWDTVKNALKELKATYTETDILDMFNQVTGHCVRGKILETHCDGFNHDTLSDNVSFRVEMLIYDEYSAFYHVSFYIDYIDGAFGIVERDPDILINVRKFTRDI
jgi:hypothetical protein